MKAVILAGGKGTRLYPITNEIPKPLIPVKKKPILNHTIDFLNKNGISEISIIISKDHEKDFKTWKNIYKKKLPSNTTLFTETKRAGTFGCLRIIKEWIGGEDFIVFNGDSLIDFDIQSLIKFHKKNKGIVTACILQSNSFGDYIVPVIKNNKIKKLQRKPVNPLSDFICSGFYVVRPDIFVYDSLNQNILFMEKDIFPKLIKKGILIGFVANISRFYDCGTLKNWEQAILEW